jgi:hypothetical protein
VYVVRTLCDWVRYLDRRPGLWRASGACAIALDCRGFDRTIGTRNCDRRHGDASERSSEINAPDIRPLTPEHDSLFRLPDLFRKARRPVSAKLSLIFWLHSLFWTRCCCSQAISITTVKLVHVFLSSYQSCQIVTLTCRRFSRFGQREGLTHDRSD